MWAVSDIEYHKPINLDYVKKFFCLPDPGPAHESPEVVFVMDTDKLEEWKFYNTPEQAEAEYKRLKEMLRKAAQD